MGYSINDLVNTAAARKVNAAVKIVSGDYLFDPSKAEGEELLTNELQSDLKTANNGSYGISAESGAKLNYGNDINIMKYELPDGSMTPNEIGKYSIINRYAIIKYNGPGTFTPSYDLSNSKDFIYKNPTANNIINYFDDNNKAGMKYRIEDFLWCAYYGYIPNNYMLTLRRFPTPVEDNILDPWVKDKDGQLIAGEQPDLARAVTFLGETTGNQLSSVLGFSTGFNWKDVESEIQTIQSNAQGIQGSRILGIGSVGFNAGGVTSSLFTLANGKTTAGARQSAANAGIDFTKETYPNFQSGPLNVIKNLVIQEAGLKFDHSIELKFHYDLKSMGSINPKVAFLDIITNLLVLTYNSAPFFGGATRYIGNGNFGSPLGNHELLAKGDTKGFLNSVMTDIGDTVKTVMGNAEGGFSFDSVLGGFEDIANDVLGGILSSDLNTPQAAQVAQAFLSGSPTGNWHLTVGNPLNPIAMIGNLVLEDTTWEFGETLGFDDFPNSITLTIKLKPGRPRDRSEIERMFNAGRGRLYHTPSDLEDILNNEGAQPKKVTGYGRDINDPMMKGYDETAQDSKGASHTVSTIEMLANQELEKRNTNKHSEFNDKGSSAILINNTFSVTEA